MVQNELLKTAQDELSRLQTFEVKSLVQKERLGTLNFEAAVSAASKLVDFYKKLTITALDDFPDKQLNVVIKSCQDTYNIIDQIIRFNLEEGNPKGTQGLRT